MSLKLSDKIIGVLFLVSNQIIFGITPIAIKSVNSAFPETLFVLTRFVISCLLFALIILLQKNLRHEFVHLKKQQWSGLILLGLMASGIASFLWIVSIRYAGASIVSVITRFEIPIAIFLAFIILKEALSKQFFWLSLICFIGFSFIIFSPQPLALNQDIIKGMIAALVVALIWAIATLLGKILLENYHTSPIITTFTRNMFGGLFNLVLALVILDEILSYFYILSLRDWSLIIFVAIFHSTLGFYLYYAALKRISVKSFSILLMLEPIVTVTLGLLIGEKLTNIQLTGAIIMLVSSYLLVRNS